MKDVIGKSNIYLLKICVSDINWENIDLEIILVISVKK